MKKLKLFCTQCGKETIKQYHRYNKYTGEPSIIFLACPNSNGFGDGHSSYTVNLKTQKEYKGEL